MSNGWQQILNDPEFQQQPFETKRKVAENYFKRNLIDEDFTKQSSDIQMKAFNNFLSTIGQPMQKVAQPIQDTQPFIQTIAGRSEEMQRGLGDFLTRPIAKGLAALTGQQEIYKQLTRTEKERRLKQRGEFERLPWFAQLPTEILMDLPEFAAAGKVSGAAVPKKLLKE